MTAAPWVQTTSGVAFDLLEPRVVDVKIEDVAHHLAHIGRYSGATLGEHAYNVAQHSALVARIVASWGWPVETQREGLLHDAGEAYYGDITSPVQRALRELGGGAALDDLKAGVDRVVREALGIPLVESAIVRRADLVALAIERRDLMASCDRDWLLPERAPSSWPPIVVEEATVARFNFLKLEGRLRP